MAENWGGLNNALTAWRNAVNRLVGEIRDTESDGARADAAHGSNSQHQEDADGTVDAFDMDKNLLGSSDPDGDSREDQLHAALLKDFERDNRAHLWISNRVISQHDEGWDNDEYNGENAHDRHTHFEARQDREDNGAVWNTPNAEALLREWGMWMTPADVEAAVDKSLAKYFTAVDKGHEEVGQAVHDKLVGQSGLTVGTHLQRTLSATSRLETAASASAQTLAGLQVSATSSAETLARLEEAVADANAALARLEAAVPPPEDPS